MFLTAQFDVSNVPRGAIGEDLRMIVMASLNHGRGDSSDGVERVMTGTADASDFGAAEASAPDARTPLAAIGEVMGSVANCVIGSQVILPVSSGGVSVVT
jgi:hypothetical protein